MVISSICVTIQGAGQLDSRQSDETLPLPGYDVKSPVIYLNELHVSEGDKRNRGFIIISKVRQSPCY